jgi:integrase/recombinase XerC
MTTEHEALVDSYRAHLVARNYKPRGIAEKLRAVRLLLANTIDLACFGVRDAEAWRESLSLGATEDATPRFHPRTVNAQLAHLRHFFAWCVAAGMARQNPFTVVDNMKQGRKLPANIYTIDEMGRLLQGLVASDPMLRVAVEMLYATGMRVSELETLERSDIDLAACRVVVRDDKDRRDRSLPLTECAGRLLGRYLERVTSCRPFARAGNRSLDAWLNYHLRRVCKSLKLPRISAHGFRHAVATHLLKKGASIREVQEYLGHRRIRNTETYTRVTTEDVRHVIERFHPRATDA